MQEQSIFILSERYLKSIIDQVTDDQWDLKVDEKVSKYRPGITLRELINYHAYDDSWVPDTLAGKTIDEVGTAYDGDLLGEDPKASYAIINAKSQSAAEGITDLDKVVHLTYGDFPTREYLKHVTSYRGFQGWNIARFIGVDDAMPAELVTGMTAEIIPSIDEWRAMGVFGPEIPAPADADEQTQLLCKTGFYYPK